MARRNSKVVKYRKPRNINVGFVICAAIITYLVIFSLISLSRDKITIYEVTEGQSADTYSIQTTGLILRTEEVFYAEQSGYIDFYVGDGSVVSVDGDVYAIDSSGTISDAIKEATEQGDVVVSDDSGEIQDSISEFNLNFDETDFSEIYDFEYSLDSDIIDSLNSTILEEIESDDSLNLTFVTSTASGIIAHYTDGYEDLTEDDLTEDLFDETSYSKTTVSTNDLVEEDSAIYKIVTSSEWSIVFPLTEDEQEEYADTTSLTVTFDEDDIDATADFEIITADDGSVYGKLSFNKYMIRYLSERFIDISIYDDTVTGYKIPVSSVTQKDYYIIPVAFLCTGGDSDSDGFYKQVYEDDGTLSVEFVSPTIYYSTDDYYYVDTSSFDDGDIIVMDDSSSTYQISETEPLDGVYNVNAGYAEFRLVDILAESNDYYIVDESTSYGLSNYDNIVLDASTVEENQVVFQ